MYVFLHQCSVSETLCFLVTIHHEFLQPESVFVCLTKHLNLYQKQESDTEEITNIIIIVN